MSAWPSITEFRTSTAASSAAYPWPDDSPRRGLAGPGQHPDRDVHRHTHFAGAARQMAARKRAGNAAQSAARQRAAAQREQDRRQAAFRARAHGSASQESGRAPAATRFWTRSDSRSKISTRSAQWRTVSESGEKIDARACSPTEPKSMASRTCARRCLSRPNVFVGTMTEKLMTYALGRGARILRHAGRARGHARGRAEQLSFLIVDSWNRRRARRFRCADRRIATRARNIRSRHQEAESAMIITKKHLPRRTFLRGLMGATIALPLLDSMIPALTAATKTAPIPRRGSASSTFRTAR